MGALNNRIALVTGSARGIGKGITARLARDGATVVVADALADRAEQAAEETRSAGWQAKSFRLDVTDITEVERVCASVIQQYSRLEILVNNADNHLMKRITNHTDEGWNYVFNVNASGVFYCLRAAARCRKEQRWGRIVDVFTILTGTPHSSFYEASKRAVMDLTKCLMYELAPYGITVNAVSSGAVDTTFYKKEFGKRHCPQG